MAEEHIPEGLLKRFLQVAVSKEESREVVRHLMTGCPECAQRAHDVSSELGLWFGRGEVAASWQERYEEIFERALVFASQEEQRIALEKLRGWGQWATIEPLSPEQRYLVVKGDRSFHTFGFYDRLLEASRWYMRREPREAADIVRLAIFVAEQLDRQALGSERVGDLRAAAWAILGNVERLASNFKGARSAFNEAWRVLEEEGSNGPAEQAHLIGLEAGYIRDMGEFETAEIALEEALILYRQLGDSHQEGRTYLKMADAIGDVAPERALAHLRSAVPLIEPGLEPRLDLCLQHDLALYLNESGRPQEALSVLEQARPLYKQFPDDWTQLRLHWLEGKIARNLGELDEAEGTFKLLWEELQARDLHHELVLVSIDLAETLVTKGESSRAEKLVEDCYPLLKAWGLNRYAMAAWLVLEEAIREKRSGEVFKALRQYYLRHWTRPAVFEVHPLEG